MSEVERRGVEEKPSAEAPGEDGKWKPTPIEVTHPEKVDPGAIRLFHEPAWRLRMSIEGDRSYLKVKIVRAAPLTQPDRYVCFLDAKDEAICMVEDPSVLGDENNRIIAEELAQRRQAGVVGEQDRQQGRTGEPRRENEGAFHGARRLLGRGFRRR